MWIGDLDVPSELVSEARAGNLVVFVGAGASRDTPSDLPDFRLLTANIAAEAQADFESSDLDHPDVLLGRVADDGVDVHQRVRTHIDKPGSLPNKLHEAIIDLVASMPRPRLVTTNFDLHLSSTAEAKQRSWDVYLAPALPMGDDFEGIVYLHGNVTQQSRQLIITDADFGRAYLRDAWAARFLERMFASYSVLFIGYSHGDVVMRYLARSLGPQSSRYVMTSEPDALDWRQLNLRPLAYPLNGVSHRALGDGLSRWARLLSMGLLDHRQRIAQLVAAPPSAIPEEQSYLESVLNDPQLVELFVQLAKGEAWLRWAVAQPASRCLFDQSFAPGESAPLAHWFAHQCLHDPDLAQVGLELVAAAGGRIAPLLWNALGHQLHVINSPRPPRLETWLLVLIENAPPGGERWLEYALAASSWPDHRTAALLLFDHLLEPHAVMRPSLGPGHRVTFEVVYRGQQRVVRDAWTRLIAPNLDQIASEMIPIADRHLRRAHHLLALSNSTSDGWDPVSFSRSSIAEHPQDRYGNRLGLLIDAARDCHEHLLTIDPPRAAFWSDTWTNSTIAILRRLAIHGIAIDTSRSGRDKLTWLLRSGWLFDKQLKHEVFEVLAAALPTSDDDVVARLVEEAAAGPADVTDQLDRDYAAFNALAWISQHSSADAAHQAFERASLQHPDFGVRTNPDFNTWFEAGFRSYQPPMSIEDFRTLLHDDRTAVIATLTDLKAARFSISDSSWDDAVTLVEQAVEAHPTDGFLMVEPAVVDADLIGAVIRGWMAAELDDDIAQRVIDALTHLSDIEPTQWSADIVRLLDGTRSNDTRAAWYKFQNARSLARALASALPAEDSGNVTDWPAKAINTAGGMLAEFWIHAISHDWSEGTQKWAGLDPEHTAALSELLDRNDVHGECAEVTVASQTHFFFAADHHWCRANILPLLSWDEPERAHRAWEGFLFWGRWSDGLLEAGLLNGYLLTVQRFDELQVDAQRQLSAHMAAIAVYSAIDQGSWIDKFTKAASTELRVTWINDVAHAFEQIDGNGRHTQWQCWIRGYWTRRRESIPRRLEPDESTALAELLVYLDEDLDEAIDLVLSSPAAIAPLGGLLHELRPMATRAPAACARLLAHLLASTHAPFWDCRDLQEIVPLLREQAAPEDLLRVQQEALRLGCSHAAEW